ncbi:hypothetical protein TRP8649_00596 [Pelagimonas phthalicica]|uniref:Uncharacterized protein n=1 Tax=Pelagimonas phthalicica TaxID=1037362 RepID=A0A238J806_9RHOB|nr:MULTISPECIES: hypothetical protein [Roseobacteraceae]MBO9464161.1 hypothetical protein [Tropicibacter sp. R15_0]TDS94959.1 hypothetical protein CLV87_1477 [Pelagimonas phthalicica]SMX26515.1 hypothetical protein TRP8649_00596 [Pelagimonas phthalicica]
MFRLIRLVIFVLFAFLAGILFERDNQKTLCDQSGGSWADGMCSIGGKS